MGKNPTRCDLCEFLLFYAVIFGSPSSKIKIFASKGNEYQTVTLAHCITVKIISKQFSQFQTISNWGKTVSNKFQERFQHNTLPRLMRYIDIFDKYQYFKNIKI